MEEGERERAETELWRDRQERKGGTRRDEAKNRKGNKLRTEHRYVLCMHGSCVSSLHGSHEQYHNPCTFHMYNITILVCTFRHNILPAAWPAKSHVNNPRYVHVQCNARHCMDSVLCYDVPCSVHYPLQANVHLK